MIVRHHILVYVVSMVSFMMLSEEKRLEGNSTEERGIEANRKVEK